MQWLGKNPFRNEASFCAGVDVVDAVGGYLGEGGEVGAFAADAAAVAAAVAAQPLGVDELLALPLALRGEQVTEARDVGGAHDRPAGAAAYHVSIDAIRRVEIGVGVRNLRVKVPL